MDFMLDVNYVHQPDILKAHIFTAYSTSCYFTLTVRSIQAAFNQGNEPLDYKKSSKFS
jgi:hypothetical protein